MKKLIERILNKQSGNIVITYDGYKKSSYMDRTVSDENGNIENILSKNPGGNVVINLSTSNMISDIAFKQRRESYRLSLSSLKYCTAL